VVGVFESFIPITSQWNMPIQVYTFYFALTRLASMKLLFQSLLIPCPKPLLFFFCLLRIRRADHGGAQWLDELRTNGKTVYIFCTWMMCVLPLPPWVQDLQGMCTDQWILIYINTQMMPTTVAIPLVLLPSQRLLRHHGCWENTGKITFCQIPIPKHVKTSISSGIGIAASCFSGGCHKELVILRSSHNLS